ncbi:TPA: phage tail protein [Klebsiella michiganensis]|uniref:phage tail protein n=1 Tax=Klebsiella michiganensis TaxID=1134687 RepID=UPI001CCD84D7|nr:phage tail protein [Klebsiella michiganensis]
MTAKYFAILTSQGAAKLANATMLGTKLNLTQLAVGDANGTLPTPDPAQTKLINQKRIAPLNLLTVDPDNTSQIIAEQIIPENEGGFWIREIGLYDDDGILIAVANCPETYKPQLQEGSGRTQTIRMILIVSSTSAITLKIDPSVVLATRKYVDDKVIEVKAYSDDLMKKHVNADNPHTQYPLIANALKEMADAGLVAEVLKNLRLSDSTGTVGRLINCQLFTSGGFYTPSPGMKFFLAHMVAGGGASGGVPATSSSQTGGVAAGNSGAYAYIKAYASDIGAGKAVSVGAGGKSQVNGAGFAGGTTAIADIADVTGGYGSGPGSVGATTAVAQPSYDKPVINKYNKTEVLAFSLGSQALNFLQAATGSGTGWLSPASPFPGGERGRGGSGIFVNASSAAQAGLAGNDGAILIMEYA